MAKKNLIMTMMLFLVKGDRCTMQRTWCGQRTDLDSRRPSSPEALLGNQRASFDGSMLERRLRAASLALEPGLGAVPLAGTAGGCTGNRSWKLGARPGSWEQVLDVWEQVLEAGLAWYGNGPSKGVSQRSVFCAVQLGTSIRYPRNVSSSGTWSVGTVPSSARQILKALGAIGNE